MHQIKTTTQIHTHEQNLNKISTYTEYTRKTPQRFSLGLTDMLFPASILPVANAISRQYFTGSIYGSTTGCRDAINEYKRELCRKP